jgi:hypothetical protein
MTKWELGEVLSALTLACESESKLAQELERARCIVAHADATQPKSKLAQELERARCIVADAEARQPNNLQRTAPLLLQICELSLDIFDRMEPVLETDAAKLQLRTLANTMRKTIAMAKGEPVKAVINEGDCV